MIDQGKGPAVVFLHGAGVDATLWEPQLAAFSSRYRVIAPNLPGHGDVPLVHDVPAMADYIHSQLQRRGLSSYALVGLSLGGMVALEIAGRWPREVTHLVAVESVPCVTDNPAQRTLAGWAVALLRVISPRLLAAFPARSLGAQSDSAGRYLKSALRRMTGYRNYRVLRAALSYDGRPHLINISMPTLVLVGEMNAQTHKRAQEMASALSDSKFVVIPAAGHIANRDAPAVFNDIVLEFLDANSP